MVFPELGRPVNQMTEGDATFAILFSFARLKSRSPITVQSAAASPKITAVPLSGVSEYEMAPIEIAAKSAQKTRACKITQ